MTSKKKPTRLNWRISEEDGLLVKSIVRKYKRIVPKKDRHADFEDLNLQMDIMACHMNGMPLDLAKLLAADPFNFLHDLSGISKNINRETGKIENHFLPRCALPAAKRGGAA